MERKVALYTYYSAIFPNTKLLDWKALLVNEAHQRNVTIVAISSSSLRLLATVASTHSMIRRILYINQLRQE